MREPESRFQEATEHAVHTSREGEAERQMCEKRGKGKGKRSKTRKYMQQRMAR